MNLYRSMLFASGLLVAWIAFVAIQYASQRIRMLAIAQDLYMDDDRSFYVVGEPLEPSSAVEGEERLLVVGVSQEDFLLCSIVRNPLYSDLRGRWKVDEVFRPEISPEQPRLPIWERLSNFPSELDLARFRSLAMKYPWVTWDRTEGSVPRNGGKRCGSPTQVALYQRKKRPHSPLFR